MDLLLGIDLGSTSIKAAAFDAHGAMLHLASLENRAVSLDPENPTWLFWDPEMIWRNVLACVRSCVQATASLGTIRALAVTGMGMDGVPVDQNGDCLYPFISWQCRRTEATQQHWSKVLGQRRIFDITGKQVMSIDTLYRMLWVKQHKPEVYAKIHQWLLIEDYVNMKLCGAMATDHSMASCTSMMDQRTKSWSDEILDACGIDKRMLPPILAAGTALGTVLPDVREATGLPSNALVVLGGHDYSCAAVAAGVIGQGKVFNITGTWEMLYAPTDQLNLSGALFEQGFKSESHVAKGRYAIFADVVSSYMLEWVRNSLLTPAHGELVSWDAVVSMAEGAAKFAGGVFFLPTLLGKGCPSIDENAMAAFLGLTPKADIACLCRAVMEGMNYQFREMLDAYERVTGLCVDQVIASGGATRNRFLMQNKADICAKPLVVSENAEDTVLGAALLAGIGVGLFRDELEAFHAVKQSFITYEPGPDAPAYARHYQEIYLGLHHSLQTINERIRRSFQ